MIRDNIKKLRLSRGLNQMQFAECLNVTQGAVSHWETGRATPDTYQLLRIAKAFDITTDELTNGEPTTQAEIMPLGIDSIPKRLCALRAQKGLSQDAVAEACNISRITLARYENGSRTPIIGNAAKLAQYYGVPTDYILGIDQPPTENAQLQKTKSHLTPLCLDDPASETNATRARLITKILGMTVEQIVKLESYVDFLLSQKEDGNA